MIQVEQFYKEDAQELKESESINLLVTLPTDNKINVFQIYEQYPNNFTMFYNDQVKFCGGVVDIWNGMGEMWMILNKDLDGCKFEIIRTIRYEVDNLFDTQYHRLQATIDCANDAAIRFVEWLGFKREGVLRKYSHDRKDYYMYARVKE